MTSKNFQLLDLKKSIVFEDTHLLVINKPAGLLSQGEHTGEANLVDLLREYLGRPYVGLVHRLDRNTSGLLVVAKRSKSAERLTSSLQEGTLKRKYKALLNGCIEAGQTLRWRHWLKKDEKTNKTEVFALKTSGCKEATLTLLSHGSKNFEGKIVSLVTLELETGRSHQIRAQSSFERFPLLGDAKYGAPHTAFGRTALHSYYLEFPHPKEGEGIKVFETDLPADMKKIFT